MLVTCEQCSTSFNLDERLVKSTGSKVRCSKCKHVFVAYPPSALETAPEEDAAPEQEQSPEEQLPDAMADRMEAPDLAAAPEGEDLDLSDIEKMLEVEDEQAGSGQVTAGPEPEDALDLSDLENILDEEDEDASVLEEEGEEEPDLVFDLENEEALAPAEDQISLTSELDLGDLDKMFDDEEASLDLEMEDEDTLSFDLETQGETSEAEALEGTDEATASDDFEDLELMMAEEAQEEAPDHSPEAEVQDLDFDLEMETTETDTAPENFAGEDGEEALSLDLEPTLGAGEPETPPDKVSAAPEAEPEERSPEDAEPRETPLAPVAESQADKAVDEMMSLLEMETEGEEAAIEIEAPEEAVSAAEGEDALEADDEASLEEDSELDFPDDAVPDIPDEEVFEEDADTASPEPEEEDAPAPAVPTEGGSLFKKVFISLLVLVLVLVIAAAALVFTRIKGIEVPFLDRLEIPFLDRFGTPGTVDPGNLKIVTSQVDSRFLDHSTAGRLFIITGKVKNSYDHPRSFIKMTGNLYTKGKVLAKTQTAYCGNVISDLELTKMDIAEIQKRLENRFGDRKANVGIPPGAQRNFLIVFSDLPENLEEFTITVEGSEPVGPQS